MKKLFHVSLQTKILVLIISLIFFVVVLLTGIYAWVESKETKLEANQLALQTAKTVSLLPSVEEALHSKHPSNKLQTISEQIRDQVNAAEVIITNREGVMYSHPNPDRIGQKIRGKDSYTALVFGGYYNSDAKDDVGAVIRGKAPIYVKHGNYKQVDGVVSVGFLKEDIHKKIMDRVRKSILVSLLVFAAGTTGSILLAKDIKKDTLGLEPFEIASLYKERSAILLAIKEGVLAIDNKGRITMLNHSAQKILGLTEETIGQPIRKFIPERKLTQVLETGKPEIDREMTLGDRVFIVNRTPVEENGKIVGVVTSFRDKTEIQNMINTLSEVRKYSEDLRAQTHEFTNKLYVLSGLLQLGEYQEAIDMIQKESEVNQAQNRILFDQIHDPKVQAILLGKIGKASEKKIQFDIDPNSSLQPLPAHIQISQLITIIGNLLDNAFEAVQQQKNGKVSFFIIDIGDDIVIEVVDNGPGIPEPMMKNIFKKRISSKDGEDRGYGLVNVSDVVNELNGMIEVNNEIDGGAIFTIFIPKRGE